MPETDSEPPDDPFSAFETWLADARRVELNDPNAMTLATATPEGRPSARIVLLKGVDRGGFVFYTNTHSRKGGELAANPFAALLFHWKTLGRQIRIEGPVEPVDELEADAYFGSRPRESRLGAWASDQSRPLPDRTELIGRLLDLHDQYPGDAIPRPPHWSGFRVRPERFEFWQDMPFRLHDRTVYAVQDGTWQVTKLYP
jgi:pyridoxamine 5'-phosphate oxidase